MRTAPFRLRRLSHATGKSPLDRLLGGECRRVRRYNAQAIRAGRVEIHLADVEKLPFAGNTFDLVTGVETHFWWPDIASGLHEIRRVLKPAGALPTKGWIATQGTK
jgi:SAM-dependent methyltransferase